MRVPIGEILLLCVTGVLAAPALDLNVLAGRAVADDLFQHLELFSQFAAAAYCFENVNGQGQNLSCTAGKGSCPRVEALKTNVTSSFEAGDSNTRGYVAVDDTSKVIVASFQGTKPGDSNIQDLLSDINIDRVETDICGTANTNDGCKVHEGFLNAGKDALGPVTTAVKAALVKNPTYRVVMSGHSLGAAIAAIVGTMLRNDGMIVDIYTYGQPHIGTADISNFIQSQAPAKGNNFRVTHFDDPVPKLPPHDIGDWDHYFPEYFINLNEGTQTASNLERVDGNLFSKSGNEGAGKSLFGAIGVLIGGVDAHKQYFGPISSCSSAKP